MAQLLLLWLMLSGSLSDGDVDALLGRRREEIRVLELHVGSDVHIFDSCDPDAPKWIMVRLRPDGIVVGEAASPPTTVTSVAALRTQLEQLKDRRKDREQVLIAVDDDVEYAHVIAVLDLLPAIELKQVAMRLTPKIGPLDPAHWVLPVLPADLW